MALHISKQALGVLSSTIAVCISFIGFAQAKSYKGCVRDSILGISVSVFCMTVRLVAKKSLYWRSNNSGLWLPRPAGSQAYLSTAAKLQAGLLVSCDGKWDESSPCR